MEDALEELVQTRVHHVDLVEDVKEDYAGLHEETTTHVEEKKPKKRKTKKETVSA